MSKSYTSIKQKINWGYYFILALIAGLSLFTTVELHFLEKRFIFGERISEFFNTVLEIRRYEKNYFLYHKQDDSKENLRYVNKALTLLTMNKNEFYKISNRREITELENNLSIYKVLMGYYTSPDTQVDVGAQDWDFQDEEMTDDKKVLQERIRETGKEILSLAEKFSGNEHLKLREMLKASKSFLLGSIIFLSLFGIGIGQLLSRMIVRSLTQLERSMEGIAVGKFEKISIQSNDREIISLTNAVNRMLRELELRQSYLVQSEKLASLGTLLSGVAHELNNPLSNISSSSQILVEEIDEDNREYKKELLTQIEEQTQRAKTIVRSLLEFSRDKDFKKEKISLKALFEETIRFIKGQIPTQVEIILDVPAGIIIHADKQRIQQAFLNLIKNAIESITGEGKVSITAQKHSEVNKFDEGLYTYRKFTDPCSRRVNTVGIKIQDSGSGIPAEVLPKVFDPFFTTKDVGKGSGLGLSIVHDIIDEHRGCIGVESSTGQGTTFLIRLPIKEI